MELREVKASGRQLVQGYIQGGFKIADRACLGPVLVFPDRAIPWELGTPIGDRGAIGGDASTLASLQPVLDMAPMLDMLVIGTGADPRTIDTVLRAALKAAGLAVEVMATKAACRTYNLLVGEDRRVAAALIPAD